MKHCPKSIQFYKNFILLKWVWHILTEVLSTYLTVERIREKRSHSPSKRSWWSLEKDKTYRHETIKPKTISVNWETLNVYFSFSSILIKMRVKKKRIGGKKQWTLNGGVFRRWKVEKLAKLEEWIPVAREGGPTDRGRLGAWRPLLAQGPRAEEGLETRTQHKLDSRQRQAPGSPVTSRAARRPSLLHPGRSARMLCHVWLFVTHGL